MLEANERKTTSVRRLGSVDIAALRERVLAIPEEVWAAENATKPNRFGALDTTRHIVFRFVQNRFDWRRSDEGPLWEQWKDVLAPVMEAATKAYGYANGDYPRVMLAQMPAGGTILPHRDENPAAKWPHKIHVPLKTNDNVTFTIDDKSYHLAEGEAVEVNNMGVHAVANEGDSDRIHLIFEYFDRDQPEPEWLEPVLAANRR